MGREIERKFLLATLPRDRLPRAGDAIEQGYVAIDAAAEVRVRRRADQATLTVKSAPARARVEEEVAIGASQFESLWSLSEGRRIVKTRYVLEVDGATIEVDEYHGALAGLVVAEVEFADEAAADAFEPPPWLGREITGDARYANQTLAVSGRPR
jgi:CYTH domain-containing protein